MARRVCLVSYHEIGLKGHNRRRFEDALLRNLRVALSGLGRIRVERLGSRVMLSGADEAVLARAASAACQVPGVAKACLAVQTDRSDAALCDAAVTVLGEVGEFTTFKVHARKSNTDDARHTIDINRTVGSALCEAFPDKVVRMHEPDVTVTVLVTGGDGFVFCAGMAGVGGLPVGSAGKVMALLSSGFDSPVASWMIGRRGAVVCPVHFSGRPVTTDESEYAVADIMAALAPAGIAGRLYVVPFGEAQRQIALESPQSLRILMYRRLMFHVTERIAALEGAKAIVTGESLGQVASQTLENIRAVEDVLEGLPVLRPLIGSDKVEIIERAHRLGTYELSSQKVSDCCTLFMPRRPETHARLEEVRRVWDSLAVGPMTEELLARLEYVDLPGCPAYRAPQGLEATPWGGSL